MRAWSVTRDGVVLAVRLVPKAGRDAIDGVSRLADGSAVVVVRVRAPPIEGEANAALIRVLARSLDVPGRALSIVGGATARLKRIKVAGDPAALDAMLARRFGLG